MAGSHTPIAIAGRGWDIFFGPDSSSEGIGVKRVLRFKSGAIAASFLLVAFTGTLTVVAKSSGAPGASSPEMGETSSNERSGSGYLAPMTIAEIRADLNADAAKPRFDGTIQGWRLATSEVLAEEGIASGNLELTCIAHSAGEETPTQLDFTLGYVPEDLTIEATTGPEKSICGDDAYSVFTVYNLDTPMGSGDLFISRRVWGRRALDLYAASDGVEAGTINGMPAIFVRPANSDHGLGVGQVIVIEDDTGPEFTVLRVYNDNGVPFDELVKIAEGIE